MQIRSKIKSLVQKKAMKERGLCRPWQYKIFHGEGGELNREESCTEKSWIEVLFGKVCACLCACVCMCLCVCC